MNGINTHHHDEKEDKIGIPMIRIDPFFTTIKSEGVSARSFTADRNK